MPHRPIAAVSSPILIRVASKHCICTSCVLIYAAPAPKKLILRRWDLAGIKHSYPVLILVFGVLGMVVCTCLLVDVSVCLFVCSQFLGIDLIFDFYYFYSLLTSLALFIFPCKMEV